MKIKDLEKLIEKKYEEGNSQEGNQLKSLLFELNKNKKAFHDTKIVMENIIKLISSGKPRKGTLESIFIYAKKVQKTISELKYMDIIN